MHRVLIRTLLAGLVWSVLAGCTTMTPHHLGIRPDEPSFTSAGSKRASVCDEFKEYAEYTQRMQEAYHSRASQNRFWIYASGTTALGTAAATAGVAALAASSSGTLVLLPIAGAFASGVFGVLDNPTLADIYTIAAGRLETARQEAEAKLELGGTDGKNRYANGKACADAYNHLREAVGKAKNDLERARTDSASAALQRTAAQADQFNKVVKQAQDQQTALDVQNGEITAVTPREIVADGQEKEVALTVSKADFSAIGFEKLKVRLIDKQMLSVSSIGPGADASSYLVKFMAPAKPPTEGVTEYSPTLLVGSTQTAIRAKSGVTLQYKQQPTSTGKRR